MLMIDSDPCSDSDPCLAHTRCATKRLASSIRISPGIASRANRLLGSLPSQSPQASESHLQVAQARRPPDHLLPEWIAGTRPAAPPTAASSCRRRRVSHWPPPEYTAAPSHTSPPRRTLRRDDASRIHSRPSPPPPRLPAVASPAYCLRPPLGAPARGVCGARLGAAARLLDPRRTRPCVACWRNSRPETSLLDPRRTRPCVVLATRPCVVLAYPQLAESRLISKACLSRLVNKACLEPDKLV